MTRINSQTPQTVRPQAADPVAKPDPVATGATNPDAKPSAPALPTDGQVIAQATDPAAGKNPTAPVTGVKDNITQDGDVTIGVGGVIATPMGGFGAEVGWVSDNKNPRDSGFYVSGSVRAGAEVSAGVNITVIRGGDAEGRSFDVNVNGGPLPGTYGVTETGEPYYGTGVGVGLGASSGVAETRSVTINNIQQGADAVADVIGEGVDRTFDGIYGARDWVGETVTTGVDRAWNGGLDAVDRFGDAVEDKVRGWIDRD